MTFNGAVERGADRAIGAKRGTGQIRREETAATKPWRSTPASRASGLERRLAEPDPDPAPCDFRPAGGGSASGEHSAANRRHAFPQLAKNGSHDKNPPSV